MQKTFEEKREEAFASNGHRRVHAAGAAWSIAVHLEAPQKLVHFEDASLLQALAMLSQNTDARVPAEAASILLHAEYALRHNVRNFDFDSAIANINAAGELRCNEVAKQEAIFLVERSDAIAEAREDGIASAMLAGAL